MTRLASLLCAGTVGIVAMLAPPLIQEARACGGTFCDVGPQQMPVDQTGETIVFVLDGDYVEAHIQIQYDGGDASKFAWMVPVFGVPEVEVGSFQFIQNALDGTVPLYSIQNTFECDPGDTQDTGIGFLSSPDGGGVSSEDDEPEILVRDTAGAFEFVVLQGGTAETVMQWLADNDFAEDAEAPEIIQTYLDEGAVFAAFKLAHAQGLDDIHPITLRYQGMEPCIPLRLTRIAAKEDMDIRALFLGQDRVLPTSYRHVRLNRTRLDWSQLGVNYPELVSMAIDEAGGRAFVTEYAGPSNVISAEGMAPEQLNPAAFGTLEAVELVDELRAQGLMSCTDTCVYQHDLVQGLLSNYLPVPAGFDADTFYSCPSCYEELIDQSVWDAAAFEADFRERIYDPMVHALDVLATWPYVTRLYTRISPHEMLADPFFEEVSGLGDVPNRLGAQRISRCCDTAVRLPGGREVLLTGGAWPEWSDEMPWAERIEEFQPAGPPATMVDNTELIDGLVHRQFIETTCEPGGGTTGGEETTGDGDDSFGSDTGPMTGDDANTGAGADDEGGAAPMACVCSNRGNNPPPGVMFALLGGLLGLVRRRR